MRLIELAIYVMVLLMVSVEAFDETQLHIYRAWEAYVGDESAVETDFAPRSADNPYAFETDGQVRAELEKQLEQTPIDCPAMTRQKLEAAIMYLRAKGGEEIDFSEYIETTMGMKPFRFSETELDNDAAKLTEYIEGYYDLKWDESSQKAFKEATEIREDETAKIERANALQDWAQPRILHLMGGLSTLVKPVEPVLVNEDESWQAWWTTNADGELMYKLNISPKHPWNLGEVAEVVTHEKDHVITAAHWKEAILNSRLRKSAGLISTFSQETAHLETLAITMSHIILGNEVSLPDYPFQVLYSRYQFKVANNVRYMVNNGTSEIEAAAYDKDHLPLDPEAGDLEYVRQQRDDPLKKAWKAAYGIAIKLGEPILSMTDTNQVATLQQLHEIPLTTSQVAAVIAQVA